MKKSIRSVFLVFVFLTVLLSGCTPASTPIPSTLTLTPTVAPTPTLTAPTPTLTIEEIIAVAVQTTCQRRPAASAEVGASTDGRAEAQLCPDVMSGITLPQEWIAKTPESLRYVVAIQGGTFSGFCGPYTINGLPPAPGEIGTFATKSRQFVRINLIDTQTGEVVDATRVVGPKVNCPYKIAGGGEVIMGDAVSVQAIQTAMVDLLSKPLHFARKTLQGHTNYMGSTISSVAFSPDGKLLASGLSGLLSESLVDNTVTLWDVSSGQEVRTLEGHTGGVTNVAFSPDGKLLASGSMDNTVKLWDVANGQEVTTLEGHTDFVTSVAFSPDGKLLASGSYDKTLNLWDVASGQEVRTLKGHTAVVASVVFSPDGKLLASGSNDNTVKLWDVASGQTVRTLKVNDILNSVAFSPDGKLLASGSYNNTVLWDVASGKEVRTLEVKDGVNSVAFSPDGKLLASGPIDYSGNGTGVKLWNVASGDLVYALEGYTGNVESDVVPDLSDSSDLVNVAFSPDGTLLASTTGSTVILWEIKAP